MHTPIEVTAEAMRIVEEQQIDCLVAIGGGSTTGLSKAIAYRTSLPQIVIPTTYAGSEMTPILGQTEDGVKTTLAPRSCDLRRRADIDFAAGKFRHQRDQRYRTCR